MRPSEALRLHRAEILRTIEENHTCNPRVFGSVLSGEDVEGSDLDLLVDSTPDTTLLDIAKIQNRLQKLLGVSVDILTPNALPARHRRQIIADSLDLADQMSHLLRTYPK